MKNMRSCFENRVNSILSNCCGKTLLCFKGFANEQIEQLIVHPRSLLNDPSLIKDGFLDVDELNDKWIDFVTAIKMTDKPLVCFYEELLVIKSVLNKVALDQIVIVENNILSPWVPSYYPHTVDLALFDFWQQEHETKDAYIKNLTEYYGDVKLLNDRRALLLPATLDDERIKIIPFWDTDYSLAEPDPTLEMIETGSLQDWEFCLSFTRGQFASALFLQIGGVPDSRHRALLAASNQFGIKLGFDDADFYKEKFVYDESQFVPTLKKYWGDTAKFRPLLFYKDPDRSRDTETLSQGQIIAEIVDQCEAAQSGDSFSNVFITAPTGSGKSILFQIPAIYLAEKYNLVTIVVSPLIALMNDQVDQLQRERGISIAACINSSMSIEDRTETINRVQAGKISLLYLAPELLLTTHLQSFLGGRKIGLIVIDEAHTVTSWGRDFRSDYWFLGDFLKKTTRDGLIFPVLCLTATAVYSGEDDVVNDTIQELGLGRTIIHLGNVKRDNIVFDIKRHDPSTVTGKIETAKMDLTLRRVRNYIADGEKVLTYFPYRSQVDLIYNQIATNEHVTLRRYHSKIPTAERKMVERDYKAGTAMGLFCTKAFGMGIDVGDIKHVVHFAPTGTLSDYVQEIGRAARNPDILGIAHIDYFPSDLRYVRSLNGISEMRQYQLREMLKKLCAIYRAKKRRNLLIASETFEYLFGEKEVENRTKSGLMLLAKDLSNKYTFPVLIVRPKAMLSKNYINVPTDIEQEFLAKYGEFAKLQDGVNKRTIAARYRTTSSDTTAYSVGNTYLVDMAGIWEHYFPDYAFGMFKREFFEKGVLLNGVPRKVYPRVQVQIRYTDDYAVVVQRLEKIIHAMTALFENYKRSDTKLFTLRQFETDLAEQLEEKILAHDKVGLLLDIFTENVDENAAYSQYRNRIRVLRIRKQKGQDENAYFVSNMAYAQLPNFIMGQMKQCVPNHGDNSFSSFYPLEQNRPIGIMSLLRLLEVLGLANYEIRGGEKAEVFIRINDPEKLDMLASGGKYTNTVLQAIREKHKRNEQLLSAFFSVDMDTNARWELIEQYFLGNETYVLQALSLE